MPIIIAGLVLAFLVMLPFGGTELDRSLILLIGEDGGSSGLRQPAGLLAALADPLPLLIVSAAGSVVPLVRRDWRCALLLVSMVAVGLLATAALQLACEELRPRRSELLLPTQEIGFPNAQASGATIAAFALAFLTTGAGVARNLALGFAAAFSFAAGAAPLIAGAAWPSDLIAGWAFGLAWTLGLLRLAGMDMAGGTARPLRHSPFKGEAHGKPQDRNRARDG
jgi:undecaprenyl-diphosphatase